MNKLVGLGFALAVLPVAACTTNPVNPMAATIPQPVAPTASVSAADNAFALQAAQSDQFEIQTSQLALQKARRPAVRAYAQRMIDHHTMTTQQLSEIAANKRISMPVPAPLEPQQQQIVGRLQETGAGPGFERQYLNGQVSGHVATVQIFEQQIAAGTDPDLKAFAQQGLPLIQQHLAEARRLSGGC